MTSARMIAPDHPTEAAPLLRREFALDEGHGAVERATLRTSALGVVEAWVNGIPSSDELLAPGWTSYEWRVRLVEHDVTDAVAERTVIGLRLGNGWWRGWLGFTGQRAVYGDERAGYAELEVVFADGHVQTVGTDETWRAASGEVLADDLYNGETIDARLRGRRVAASGIRRCGLGCRPRRRLRRRHVSSPPRRRRCGGWANSRCREHWTSPSGKTLVDFGQNLVGFVRVRVAGPAGTEVVLRHAEVLEHDELGTRPLRRAEATDRFILSGGDDVFEPTLTFHGFRYAEVTGWPGEFDPAALTAVVVGTEIAPIGSFECSNPELNQLHSNVDLGHEGQLPQRADRLPAARRAPRLDGRSRGLRADGGVPRRRRVVPRRLADRRRARAPCDARADCAGGRAERHEVPRHRLPRTRAPPRSGETPRCGCRGRSGRRTGTSRRCATRIR